MALADKIYFYLAEHSPFLDLTPSDRYTPPFRRLRRFGSSISMSAQSGNPRRSY